MEKEKQPEQVSDDRGVRAEGRGWPPLILAPAVFW
jgi:hypothetical protein